MVGKPQEGCATMFGSSARQLFVEWTDLTASSQNDLLKGTLEPVTALKTHCGV